MDLSTLTIDAAKPLAGTTFEVSLDGGARTELRLVDVLPYELQSRRVRGTPTPKRAPFAMYFLGSPDVVLPQGCYTLRAGGHVLEQVFLVPVGRDEQATEYEAVFT